MLNSIITPKGNISVKSYKEYLQYYISLYNNPAKITKVKVYKNMLSVAVEFPLTETKTIDVPIGIMYQRTSKYIMYKHQKQVIEVSFFVDMETILAEEKVIAFLNSQVK